jgi:C_GCAxxG_C_C family probable redox protein
VNKDAFRIYKFAAQGYCCTQIMLKMVLEEEGKKNDDLIKAVHGLCGGVAYSRKTCGAMIGGICILGLYAGKGAPAETYNDNYMKMMKEYMEWFQEEFESTECADLIGVHVFTDDNGDINYPVKCGDILSKCYDKIQEILYRNEYDFGDREIYD